MADVGGILGSIGGEKVSSAAFGLVNIVVFIVIGLILLVIAGFALYWIMKYKRYKQFKVVVWSIDKEKIDSYITEGYDQAGIFVDRKTKNKRFFLLKGNVGLDPDEVPYIIDEKGKKVVYVLRTGLKNYHYIKPAVAYPNITLTVGEEDVNWAVNSYERAKKMFSQSTLLQWMPFIILGFVCIIILVIFVYFFKNFEVLRDVALAFKDAASEYAKSQMNTTIIPT